MSGQPNTTANYQQLKAQTPPQAAVANDEEEGTPIALQCFCISCFGTMGGWVWVFLWGGIEREGEHSRESGIPGREMFIGGKCAAEL